MAQVQGLEIFDEHNNKILDLTKFIPKYLGEADIIPTQTSQECSGVIPIQHNISQFFVYPFFVIDKVYAQNLPISNGINYVLPELISITRNGITWQYSIYSTSVYSQYINLPVHVKYGVF